jgi:hypothetical protein
MFSGHVKEKRGCVKSQNLKNRLIFIVRLKFFEVMVVAVRRYVKWRAATAYFGHFLIKKECLRSFQDVFSSF